ncbi:MAG: heparinase, partial [Lentisphaerae bacterium]
MSLFLTPNEREAVQQQRHFQPMSEYLWVLRNRALARAVNPGIIDHTTTVEWWHCFAEYMTDGAMAYALFRDETVGCWLRSNALASCNRPLDDWIGPWFRNHHSNPPLGHLETAHLSWGVAVTYDLAKELFSAADAELIRTTLVERAIPLCRNWLEAARHLNNWRCVLLAGLTTASAVCDREDQLDFILAQHRLCTAAFQADGSYGESLQYSNYAMYGLMIATEALLRWQPELAKELDIAAYARGMRWHAASLFYRKPLEGWGPYPRPRAANFNDSAAMFAPSSDVLCHIAVRAAQQCPEEAGLAAWILETFCPPTPEQQPTDRHT